MDYSVLLVATGKDANTKKGYHKLFHNLKDGRTVLDRTLHIFLSDKRCKQLVIVTNRYDIAKIVNSHEDGRIVSVNGGKTRQESVLNGLMAIKESVVLIHEAARPWVDYELIDGLLDAMETEKAACLVVKSKTNIKRIENGYVKETLLRDDLYMVQTPQAFETSFIIDCYLKATHEKLNFMDDCDVVEQMSSQRVRAVEGSYFNVKVNVKE